MQTTVSAANTKESVSHQGALKLGPIIATRLFSELEYFQDKTGKKFEITRTWSSQVSAVKVGNYLFLTQNHKKSSKWARRARAGEEIMWILYKPQNQTGAYVGRVVGGKATAL